MLETTTEQERIAEATQIAEEFKDLPFLDPDFDFSPEQYEKMFEDHRRELDAEKNSTMLFDPTDKNRRTYADCKDRYGKAMADKLLKAKKENKGFLPKQDYAELMRQNNTDKPPPKTRENKQPKSKSNVENQPFIKLDHRLLRSSQVRKALRKSMALYLYLRTYIVRESFAGDKLGLYETYYKKGKLAAGISVRKLAKDWSLSLNTVMSYIEEMSKAGIIKVEKGKFRRSIRQKRTQRFCSWGTC